MKVRSNLQAQMNGDALKDVLEQLRRSPAGLDESLKKSISFGVAYHHAGTVHLASLLSFFFSRKKEGREAFISLFF